MGITKEQREQRKLYLGGSDVAAILGLSKWRTPKEVQLEKLGKLENEDFQSEAASLGDDLEKPLLKRAARDVGAIAYVEDLSMEGPSKFMRANLDAMLLFENVDKLDMSALKASPASITDIKTSGLFGRLSDQWGEPGTDEVPQEYLIQVMWYIGLARHNAYNLRDEHYIHALLGGKGFVRYVIHEDQELVNTLWNRASDWWTKHICEKRPVENGEISMDVLKRIKRTPNLTVQVPDDLIAAYQEADEIFKGASEAKETAKKKIIEGLGEADGGTFTGGMLTYFQQTTKAYQVLEKTYRVMRIKKEKKGGK